MLRALEGLRNRKLVFVFEGAASRAVKYGQKFADTLGLSPAETAALCVLMLRGPQTTGEIRSRSGRLHEFAGLDEVESTLQALATRSPQPLVVKLPRQTGFKESRYAHLLAGPPSAALPATASELTATAGGDVSGDDPIARLTLEVHGLRRDLDELRIQFADFRKQLE